MIGYFILFILIGIAIIYFDLDTKKKSLKFKLFTLFGFVIISSLICFTLFILLWNSSDPKEEEMQTKKEHEQSLKHIVFKNKLDETVYVIINFEYNYAEKQKIKSKIVDYYNKTDSIILNKNAQYTILLPILRSNTIKFPQNFNIVVKDSLFRVIDKYDEQTFLDKSLSSPKIECHNKKTHADFWELILKKRKD